MTFHGPSLPYHLSFGTPLDASISSHSMSLASYSKRLRFLAFFHSSLIATLSPDDLSRPANTSPKEPVPIFSLTEKLPFPTVVGKGGHSGGSSSLHSTLGLLSSGLLW